MKTNRVFAALLSLAVTAPCLGQGLEPPVVGSTFRSLDRAYFAPEGSDTQDSRMVINSAGRYQVTLGEAPDQTLYTGTLTANQLAAVRRNVLLLQAGTIQDQAIKPGSWGYSVKVDANANMGGSFAGAAWKRQQINDILGEFDQLERTLVAANEVDTPSDAEGYDESLVDTPSDAEGYDEDLVDTPSDAEGYDEDLVDTPSDAEGLAGILDHDFDLPNTAEDQGTVDTPSDAEGADQLEQFAGRLDAFGGSLTIGSGDTLELTGSKRKQIASLRRVYDGPVVLEGMWLEDSKFEVNAIVSPAPMSAVGSYDANSNALITAKTFVQIPLSGPSVPSLNGQQVVVIGWQAPEDRTMLVRGFAARTSARTEMLVTYSTGKMRDVPVAEGTRILVRGEHNDVYLVLVNGIRGSIPKSAVSVD